MIVRSQIKTKIKRNNNQFYGSGKEVRSWININDLVKYIIYFIFVKNIKYKIIDISGNDTLNNYEFLKKVFKIFNFILSCILFSLSIVIIGSVTSSTFSLNSCVFLFSLLNTSFIFLW